MALTHNTKGLSWYQLVESRTSTSVVTMRRVGTLPIHSVAMLQLHPPPTRLLARLACPSLTTRCTHQRLQIRRATTGVSTVVGSTGENTSSRNAQAQPVPPRRKDLAFLNRDDIAQFMAILDFSRNPSSILSSPEDTAAYRTDWLGRFISHEATDPATGVEAKTIVLRPRTTTEVAQILRHCSQRGLAVVPQSGNTGLVGGSVPVFDEVVLSLQRMNDIISLDPVSGIVTCEAGCILEAVDSHLKQHNFMMPLDLGAKGSCFIGGNLATNAGGLRLLRYGSLHGNVLAIEVVLPSGEVLELGKPLRKDNTGYDLKQLFIGSEGTLGVITKASILVPPAPQSVNVALLALDDFTKVQQLFAVAKRNLGEILSAFEFFDASCHKLVAKHMVGSADPLGIAEKPKPPFFVLIEVSGSDKTHDDEKLSNFLEKVLTEGGGEDCTEPLILDGAVSQDENQFREMWKLRESITESLVREGGNYKYDVSVPVHEIYNLVESMRDHLEANGVYSSKADRSAEASVDEKVKGPITHVVGFGHMGDGNLHLNITSHEYDEKLRVMIEDKLYELVEQRGGSISAEHGIGLMKADHLTSGKTSAVINAMKQIKAVFDPKGILNPYKMFPQEKSSH